MFLDILARSVPKLIDVSAGLFRRHRRSRQKIFPLLQTMIKTRPSQCADHRVGKAGAS
jgi:hypothetical protein